VVLSSFAPGHKASEAVEVGAAAFIEKQQRPDELVAKLLHTWRSTQVAPASQRPAGPRATWALEHAPLAMALVDLGDRIVMRPVGEQPLDDLNGKYRARGPSTDRARRQARAEDATRARSR